MASQQHIAAQTGDRKPESTDTSDRHRRHVSVASHGTNSLYFDCQLDPVHLTDHLKGTRKSEQKFMVVLCSSAPQPTFPMCIIVS